MARATRLHVSTSQASQPTNRRRDRYLLNDMTNQFATLRANLIARQYPNG